MNIHSNVKNQTRDAETLVSYQMFVMLVINVQTRLTDGSNMDIIRVARGEISLLFTDCCVFMFSSPCSFTQNSSSFLSTDKVNNTMLNLLWLSRNDTNTTNTTNTTTTTTTTTTTSYMNSSTPTYSLSTTHTPATTATETPVATTTPRVTTATASMATPGTDAVTNTKDTPICSFGAVTLLIGSLVLCAV